MKLTVLDGVIIGAYFLLNIGVGFYFRRRAGTSTGEYFVSGRNVAWWLAGTSMVATTFAVDTPLAVTELVPSRSAVRRARSPCPTNWKPRSPCPMFGPATVGAPCTAAGDPSISQRRPSCLPEV